MGTRVWPLAAIWILWSLGGSAEPIYKITTPLPEPLQMYGAAVIGDFLYVVGGNKDGAGHRREVQMAPILPDGSLGAWTPTTPMPGARAYINNTTVVVGNTLYVVEGEKGDALTKSTTIYWATAKPDGHLGDWLESASCPSAGVSCAVALVTPGFLHLIGGTKGESTPVTNVWSARLASDGAVTGWEPGPDLPVPLWFHCAGVVGDWVYVWSGLQGKNTQDPNLLVYRSPILRSGALGEWVALPDLFPGCMYSASCTVSDDYLMSFCPRYEGAVVSGDIWYSIVGPQGPTVWNRIEANIPAKHYSAVATDSRRGTVYLPGGRVSNQNRIADANVYYLNLSGRAAASVSASMPASPSTQAAVGAVPSTAASVPSAAPAAAVPNVAPSDSLAAYGVAIIPTPAAPAVSTVAGGEIRSTTVATAPNTTQPSASVAALPALPAGFSTVRPAVAAASTAPAPTKTPEPAATTEPAAKTPDPAAMTNSGRTVAPPSGLPSAFLSYEPAKELYTRHPRPIVIYFHTPSTTACENQLRTLAELPPDAFPSRVIFTQVNPAAASGLAGQMGVKSAPAWLFFDAKGAVVDRVEGTVDKDGFVARIQKLTR